VPPAMTKKWKYYSLNHNALNVSFQAVIQGLASDKGCIFQSITYCRKIFLIRSKIYQWRTLSSIRQFVGDEIQTKLKLLLKRSALISRWWSRKRNLFSELFHGPTWRSRMWVPFMSRCLGYFNRDKKDSKKHRSCSDFWRYRWRRCQLLG
jgi:threonine synthase